MTHQYVNMTLLGHGIHDITLDTWAHEHAGGSLHMAHDTSVREHDRARARYTWAQEHAGGSAQLAHDT